MAMAWGVMAPAAPAEPEPAPPVVDDEEEDFPAMGAVVMKVKGGNVEDEYRCVSHGLPCPPSTCRRRGTGLRVVRPTRNAPWWLRGAGGASWAWPYGAADDPLYPLVHRLAAAWAYRAHRSIP